MKEENDSPDESRSATKHPKKQYLQEQAAGDDEDNSGDDYDDEEDQGADVSLDGKLTCLCLVG
jgi:hypothetical protein